ncbi:BTB domain-containing protein [Caenorhabditis elegans]|uniref:BTB domain-containing protein n=1 Tax=Caenorhabditis elegans TaxID=6239 RepID=Q9TZA7_CAEEL|nr:BTB domain-containing protein [Caenorhabditis elegans]CCD66463.1 BTB domain-containing protein [Caenorhabditis elegans]|eukprot:NP_494198.3 Uncharacterized protein CELE_C40A11.2 [Caenorhabditis elegans]
MDSIVEPIKLDIGGTVFETCKLKLTKFDGFFKTMLTSDIPVSIDESGCIFVDRSPKNFSLILKYLKEGDDVELPKFERELQEVRREAEFYLLDGLVDLCDSFLKIRSYETSEELLHIIANCKKTAILVISYTVHNDHLWNSPESFNFQYVLENPKLDVYFKQCECEDESDKSRREDGVNKGHQSWIYRLYSPIKGFKTFTNFDKLEKYINGRL